MRRNMWGKAALGCVLYMAALWIIRDVRFGYTGDDQVYRLSIETWGSWFNWMKAYYHGNSGRVLIHGVLIVLLNGPLWLYKMITAAVITLTWVTFIRYTDIRNTSWKIKIVAIISTATVFLLIPPVTLHNSVKWMSGALNYLYPVCMLLVCLQPFWLVMKGRDVGKIQKILTFLAVFLCANMEQAASVLAAMGIVCLCYCVLAKVPVKQSNKLYLTALWIVNLTVALIGYCAPGNAMRKEAEMGALAGYSMLTLGDTFVLGVQMFIRNFYSLRGLLLWMLPIVIAVLIFLRKRQCRKVSMAIGCLVLTVAQNVIMRKLFDIEFIHPYNVSYVIWLACSIALLFYTGYIISLCIPEQSEQIWFLFLYYGAVAAVVVTCLSPTVYISEMRTCYIAYILVGMIAVKLGVLLLQNRGTGEGNLCRGLSLVTGSIIIVGVIGLFLFGVHKTQIVMVKDYQEDPNYEIEEIHIDHTKGIMTATASVQPFAFVAENWCSGKLNTYDINLQLGVLDETTGEICLVKTCLNPTYPVMGEYSDDKVKITGYFGSKFALTDEQIYVIVYETHNGEQYYNALQYN